MYRNQISKSVLKRLEVQITEHPSDVDNFMLTFLNTKTKHDRMQDNFRIVMLTLGEKLLHILTPSLILLIFEI